MKKVGEILEEARVKRGLTIKDSSKFTRIHEQYLKALEDGNYALFSDSVHIRGFLQNYSKFLGLQSQEVLAVWRREYKDTEEVVQNQGKSKVFAKFVLTPQIMVTIFIVIISTFFSWYVYSQYRSYAGVPPLLIESPEDNLVTSSKEIWIKGMSYKNAFVYVNGQEAKTTETGSFRFPVSLEDGLNTFVIKASNRLGKETEVKVNVLYRETE